MRDTAPIKSPTLAQETERLRKWREVRRQASVQDQVSHAATDRKTRLEQFETDKAARIHTAEERRRQDAKAIEARRMEKARVHLEALDDIETARAALITARSTARRITAALLAAFIGLPTVLTACYFTFVAAPVFHATSVFALEGASPIAARNPLFNEMPSNQNGTMAAAFQLRVQMDPLIEIAVDTTQGLVIMTTAASNPTQAYIQNLEALKTADTLAFPALLKVLSHPLRPERPTARVLRNTLMAFLTSLSIFSIIATFFQSFRHYARD